MGTAKVNKNLQIEKRIDNYLVNMKEMMGLDQRVIVEGLILGLQNAYFALKEEYPDISPKAIWRTLKQKVFDKTEPLYHVVKNIEWSGGIKE